MCIQNDKGVLEDYWLLFSFTYNLRVGMKTNTAVSKVLD